MATPYFDAANNSWKIKVKTDKGWKPKILGPGKPGQPISDNLLKLAEPYMGKATKVIQASPETTDHKAGTTLEAYCQGYRKRYLKRPESIRRLDCVLTHFRGFAAQSDLKLLSNIGVKEINAFVDWRREQGTANSTITADLAMLQGLFRDAIEEGEHPGVTTGLARGINPVRSPASKVRQARNNETAESDDDDDDIKYYTREQQAAILNSLTMFGDPKYVDFVKIMLATGMRANALVNLEFKWITDYRIKIPKRFDKGKSGYTTYLFGDGARNIVNRRFDHFKEGKVFPEIAGTTQVYHYLGRFYLNKRHKIPVEIAEMGAYNHAWRHTFATNRVEDGVSIAVLKDLMGHHDIRITQRYAKVSNDALLATIDMVENKIRARAVAI